MELSVSTRFKGTGKRSGLDLLVISFSSALFSPRPSPFIYSSSAGMVIDREAISMWTLRAVLRHSTRLGLGEALPVHRIYHSGASGRVDREKEQERIPPRVMLLPPARSRQRKSLSLK